MNIISGNSWKHSDIVEGALLPSALSLALSLHSPTPHVSYHSTPADAAAPSLWHCSDWGGRPLTRPSEQHNTRHVTQ